MPGLQSKMRFVIMGVLGLCITIAPLMNTKAMVDETDGLQAPHFQSKKFEEQEFVPGQLIVKLKDDATIEDIKELNAKYGVTSIEKVFKEIPIPHNKLNELKDKLAQLGSEHQSWYWQLDRNSDEYKEYTAKIEKEREALTNQINALEELVSHIEQRQKRTPDGVNIPNLDTTYLLKVPESTNILQMAQDYTVNPSVEYAKPNYIMKLLAVPNDTYADSDGDGQWSEGAWGQDYEDLWGLKRIDAEAAWDISQGDGVIVAVVDTGLDYNHEDIWDNVWVNPGIVPDINPPFGVINLDDCDTSGNHYIEENEIVDYMLGWNFGDDNANPMDTHGHGTHCAGTIAAVGNNNQGIIGVAPQAKIMGIKVMMSESDLAAAIYYAADNGADIISCSWGGYFQSTSVIITAIDYAYSQGCVIVAAAGNDNRNVSIMFPAALDNVIAVAATNQNDEKVDFSNFGTAIDVAAPGGDSATGDGPDGPTTWKLGRNILSLRAQGTDLYGNGDEFFGNLPRGISLVPQFDSTAKYYRLRGTSMSCPHVAGVAALLLSNNPTDTNEEVASRIAATTDPFSEDYFGMLGTGRVNAYKALTTERKPFIKIKEVYLQEQDGDGDQIPEPTETIQLTLEVENVWEDASSVTINLSTASSYIASIPTASVDFGTISQGQTKDNGADPFVFIIGATPYQFDTPVAFHLDIIADGINQSLSVEVSLGIRRLPSSTTYKSYLSASGSKLVWKDWRHGNGEIYTYDFATELETRITADETQQTYPSISGNELVWYDSSSPIEFSALYLYDLETSQKQTIISNSNYLDCPYTMSEIPGSLSGNKIIWVDMRNVSTHGGQPDIYCYDTQLEYEQRITTNESRPKAPFISDNKIVWQDARWFASEIYLFDLDEGSEYQLTTDSGNTSQYSPSLWGNNVVWMSKHYVTAFESEKYISLYDLDTAQQRRLSYNSINQTHPVINNDNVTWCDYRHLNEDIYLFDLQTDQETEITNSLSNQWSPTLSGNRLVWLDDSYSGYNICMTQIVPGDYTNPTINGPYVNDQPLNGLVINQDISIEWMHSDTGGSGLNLSMISCEYKPTGSPVSAYASLDNVQISDTDGIAEFNAESNPDITEDSYNIRVHVEDNGGLITETIVTVSVNFDITPPSAPVVTDEGDYTSSTTTLSASWTESIDDESGIERYEYAIGTDIATEEGRTNVVNWTPVGLDTSVTAIDLSLETGLTYYFSVKAVNHVGLRTIGYSDGIMVQTDSDSDGVYDHLDNCPNDYNPNQTDTENDGLGDVCDPDDDNDTILDDGDGNGTPGDNPCTGGQTENCDDNCSLIYNQDQIDVGDGDGVGDICDNCPDDYNPGQEDTDEDGFGDVCDDCTDTDGDGYGNPGFPNNTCPLDNCPKTYNPGQEDTDGDGTGDACECYADFDGDGNVYPSDLSVFLSEYGRTDCFTTPPCQADFDNDGNVYPGDLSVFLGEYGRTDCGQ